MTQEKYTRPDSTTQAASAYKANIDNGFETIEVGAGTMFQVHAQTVPDMTVRVEAGYLYDHSLGTRTDVAAASTSTITAPVTKSRIDLVSIHQSTGVITVTAGTESSSPVAPSTPSSNFPLAQIALATSTTTITNSLITDVRVPFTVAGSQAGMQDVVDDTSPSLGGDLDINGRNIDDSNGNEIITFTETGSAVNHVNIANAASGGDATVSAVGDDTNIDLALEGKGTGTVKINGLSTPTSDGSNGDVLTTNGAGALTFSTPTVGLVGNAYGIMSMGSSPSITSQSNIASISAVTDSTRESYLISFTSTLSSANYAVLCTFGDADDSATDTSKTQRTVHTFDHTTSSFRVSIDGGHTNGDLSVLVIGA